MKAIVQIAFRGGLQNMSRFARFGVIGTVQKNVKNTNGGLPVKLQADPCSFLKVPLVHGMGVFHVFYIVQIMPNCAKNHLRIFQVLPGKSLSLGNTLVYGST